MKAENNGPQIGVSVSETLVEGQDIRFGSLTEVGVDADDPGS